MRKVKIRAFLPGIVAVAILGVTGPSYSAQTVYNVKDYGAKGDGSAMDTNAIKAAIDAANAKGGGEVYFPPGTYKTVNFDLKSNVTLNVGAGAIIQASLTQSDWGGTNSVVNGTSLNNIGVKGTGKIDGGGSAYYLPDSHGVSGNRPNGILNFKNCTNVSIEQVTLQNSCFITCKIEQCDNALLDHVIVRNPDKKTRRGTDGIDIYGGRHVTVQNCDVETGDDAYCLKLPGDDWHSPARPTHDIVFRNCIAASTTNAVKIGTGTSLEAYNLIFGEQAIDRRHQWQSAPQRRSWGRLGARNERRR